MPTDILLPWEGPLDHLNLRSNDVMKGRDSISNTRLVNKSGSGTLAGTGPEITSVCDTVTDKVSVDTFIDMVNVTDKNSNDDIMVTEVKNCKDIVTVKTDKMNGMNCLDKSDLSFETARVKLHMFSEPPVRTSASKLKSFQDFPDISEISKEGYKKDHSFKVKSDHNIVLSDVAKTQRIQLSPSLLRLDKVNLNSAERTVREVALDGLPESETNYRLLGARPKTNTRKNLLRNTLVKSSAITEMKSLQKNGQY